MVENIINEKITVKETNINLKTDLYNHNIKNYVISQRQLIERYIRTNKEFLFSMTPLDIDLEDENIPYIVKLMHVASIKSEVGPMASVAGAISEVSTNYLISKGSKFSIVDNGGDISMINNRKTICGVYANNSSLSGNIGFEIKENKKPIGICTSSGTVGHSISFGISDAVVVFSKQASLSDALATSIANHVNGLNDEEAIANGLNKADEFKEFFRGVLIILNENAGTIGKLPKLVNTEKKSVFTDLFEI